MNLGALISKEALLTSGLSATGGAVASVVARQLQKSETVTKYKYGIPIGTFVVGHLVTSFAHKGIGLGVCAVAGFQLAEMVQNDSANGGGAQQQPQQFYGGEASGYGALPPLPPGYVYQYQYPQNVNA